MLIRNGLKFDIHIFQCFHLFGILLVALVKPNAHVVYLYCALMLGWVVMKAGLYKAKVRSRCSGMRPHIRRSMFGRQSLAKATELPIAFTHSRLGRLRL